MRAKSVSQGPVPIIVAGGDKLNRLSFNPTRIRFQKECSRQYRIDEIGSAEWASQSWCGRFVRRGPRWRALHL